MWSIRNGKVRYAAVAHLVERHLAKVEVASSSLVSRSRKQGIDLKSVLFVLSEEIVMVQRFVWYSTRRAGCPHPAACKPVRLANVSPFLRSDAGGEGLRPRRAFIVAAFGGEGNARCGVQGRAPPGARGKRGYRTPGLASRFPIPPLATPPDLPVCRSAEHSRLKRGGRSAARSVPGFP